MSMRAYIDSWKEERDQRSKIRLRDQRPKIWFELSSTEETHCLLSWRFFFKPLERSKVTSPSSPSPGPGPLPCPVPLRPCHFLVSDLPLIPASTACDCRKKSWFEGTLLISHALSLVGIYWSTTLNLFRPGTFWILHRPGRGRKNVARWRGLRLRRAEQLLELQKNDFAAHYFFKI